ncbi:MAG: hypothetical protein KBT48_02330 [Firmicutes bacterium]|nr:hypothetical protein [Bacillota bacterium]
MENIRNNSSFGNLNASIVDIRGSMYYVKITYDNGYVIKVSGELFPGATFIAYKRSIKKWEAPHENEILTAEMVKKLITDVEEKNAPGKVKIVFQ